MLTSKSRRSAVWIAVALACPVVLAAQVTTKTAVLGGAGGSCPVSLHARQGFGGDMLKVAKEHPNESGQLIQISISDPEPGRHAIAANLTGRGLTAKGRAVPTGQIPSDAERPIQIRLTPGPDHTLTAEMWVPGVTTVQTIELASLTLADGSTWKLPAEAACTTAPDGFMLIGAR